MATDRELKDIAFKWFLQQRGVGNPISDPILGIEVFTAKFVVCFFVKTIII